MESDYSTIQEICPFQSQRLTREEKKHVLPDFFSENPQFKMVLEEEVLQ
jgi:hypothetical protein